MSGRRRYAIVGTGARAGMYVDALTGAQAQTCELVALCDLSRVRMGWYARRLAQGVPPAAVATYDASQFDQMLAEARPDVVIVTTIDSTHHDYICRAMSSGCDVITEKPMTTDAQRLEAIFHAIRRTGRSLRVAFNYRYAPAYTLLRRHLKDGAVGRPLAVDLSWMLDTRHGADYFRRWHREKQNSGGLLVHKATHHFDLINWWIEAIPTHVFAVGSLSFYGRANAAARGEQYPYDRYTGVPEARDDPFALRLTSQARLRGLYLEAEAETGYIRDRNVFGEPITIEDTMAVIVRYNSGALLSYSLIAYSPWEGLRVAITGTRGRIELDIEENVTHLSSDEPPTAARASTGPFKRARLRLQPMFGQAREIEVPAGEGGHGGADPLMLADLLTPGRPPDPDGRAASHLDGAASVLVGIAANESMRTGQPVAIDSLFPLSQAMADAGGRAAARPSPGTA